MAASRFRLRRDELHRRLELAGLSRNTDFGAAIGIHWSNIGRVLKGQQEPSTEFLASTLQALRDRGQEVTVDDLIEVVEVADADADDAHAEVAS